MNSELVNEVAGRVKSTAQVAASHGREIVGIGVDTAKSTRDIIKTGIGDVHAVWLRTHSEVRFIVVRNSGRIKEQLSRLTTPTNKQVAAARKDEIKEKKQRKRAARQEAAPSV